MANGVQAKQLFITAFCKAMGIETAVSSPTYSIINQYTKVNKQTIYHMDLYRLRDEEEAINAGVEDALYSGSLCLVEWPDKAANLLPENTLHLYIEAINDDERKNKLVKARLIERNGFKRKSCNLPFPNASTNHFYCSLFTFHCSFTMSKAIISGSFSYETLEETLDIKAKGAELFIGIPKRNRFPRKPHCTCSRGRKCVGK